MVGNQLSAGANLRTQTVSEFIEGGYLMPSQFDGTSEERFRSALAEAGEVRNSALGQTVQLARGETTITAPFNIPNRASIRGVNKRGSIIKADAAFVGSYMATIVNGTTSTFDNTLEHLTLDCNDVAGLSGIDSQAWQEGGGLRRVLLQDFRQYGVRFRDGFGGASTAMIRECEIFGSGVAAANTGIRVEEVSSVANFLVHVCDTTITGSAGVPMTYGIWIENDSLHCNTVHFEEVASAIYLDGVGNHVLVGVTGASTVTNLVEIAPTFTGSVLMLGCFRGGATNFIKDNRAGGLGTISWDTSRLWIPRLNGTVAEPPVGLGATVAAGLLNGTGTPALTNGFGISAITDNGTGNYTLTLGRALPSASSFAVLCSVTGDNWKVNVENLGVSTFRLETFNAAAAAADAAAIHFQVVRIA